MRKNPKTDQELFESARLLATNEDQRNYLANECHGDRSQIDRVLRLIHALQEQDSFLEGTPPGLGDLITVDLHAPNTKSDRIGPYQIIRKLGEGGMGLVYLAEQTVPVRRQVALKVIKPGMDSKYVLARFETERQTLSVMDHPNIARVFEAGSTPDGRPYFVMEWIQGVSITDYCDAHALSLIERLQLFLPVCHAVHHAHQKGIIHRDLKPSNILVASFDNRPVPKVIDFGLAKALATPSDQQQAFTMHGQIVGTIEYMSPEQASAEHTSIDTRSDLYSLGIILYELLAGAPPFDKRRLREAGWKEMVRIVQEETPPRPSTRLSSIDSPENIAALRKTDPHRLSSFLRGELDWIVMKAIEKQSQRRYESILHLADDLNRFLRSETVLARPPSKFYSLSKFSKRHRLALVATVMVLASVIAGMVGTTVGMLRARESQRLALIQSDEARRQRLIAEDNAVLAQYAAAESELARSTEREQRNRADENAQRLAKSLDDSQALLYRNQLMAARTEAEWGNPQVAEHVLQETDEAKRGWEYTYLHGMLHKNRKDFAAGYGDIASVALNEDGSLLAAGCEDRNVRIWETAKDQLISILQGHPTYVTCVRFVPGTSRQIVSGDTNGNVYAWDIDQGGKPKVLAETKVWIVGLEVSKNGQRAFFASSSGGFYEVDLSGEQPSKELSLDRSGHSIAGFSISPDENLIGSIGSTDTLGEKPFLYLHDLRTRKLIQQIDLGGWFGSSIAFSPDSKSIACGSSMQFRFGKSRGVRIYSVETGDLVNELSGNANTVACVAFSNDGKSLYGGGALDGSVSRWDLNTGKIDRKVVGLSGRTISLAINENRGLLAGGGFSNVHLWNLEGRPFQQILDGPDQLFRSAVLNANGTKVLAAVGTPTLIPDNDGKLDVINRGQVVVWNLISGRSSMIEDKASPIMQFISNPSCHRAASLHFDKTVRLWNLDSNTSSQVHQLSVEESKGAIAFLNDDELLIGDGKELKRLVCSTGEVVRIYSSTHDIVELATDRRGKMVAIETSEDFQIVRLENYLKIYERKFEEWGERAFCFNTIGSRLIFASDNRKVECLSIPTGETIWENTVEGIKLGGFTADDRRLVIGSYFDVLVVDANNGSTVLSIQAHQDLIQSVFLSFDGKQLLTVGLDNQLRVDSLP